MQTRSALARLQQVTTLGLLACASAWLAWHWRQSPGRAIAGFVIIALGYAIFLAIEFVLVSYVSRTDPAPKPTWRELIHAWLGEACIAPVVFCWRQPFRWREIPDQIDARPGQPPQRGAVFIHGFVCNRGFWTPWLRRLRAQGRPFIAVNLEPVFGSIDAYAPIIEDAVQRISAATGLPPVLVCHSMGGLAARAWLREMKAHDRVHHVITIGSPHHGTWLGRFSHLANGRQMRLHGDWVSALAGHGEARDHAGFTCWYSNCDNVVFPATTATLEGADNRFIGGLAHVEMAFHPRVVGESIAMMAG
ncbi:MAG TPA: alpha/beta fold hydrolase [Ramlibacter sp.]|nr:alpha/beta fold hydrolase [Ramlibacter sp.]